MTKRCGTPLLRSCYSAATPVPASPAEEVWDTTSSQLLLGRRACPRIPSRS